MLPRDLDRDGIETCRVRAERLLNDLTCEAEAWATAGTKKAGEVQIRPGHAPVAAAAESTSAQHQLPAIASRAA